LKRNVTIEDVGGAGVYLLSELSSGSAARCTMSIAATTSSQ
jgi:enoyl-[acyl-carrier-protein] reductase (NADH)